MFWIIKQIIKENTGVHNRKICFVSKEIIIYHFVVVSGVINYSFIFTRLPVVRQHSQQNIFDNLWDELSSCMEDFLFPPHTNVSRDLRSHDQDEDLEKLDVHLIEMIRGQILPHSGCFPRHFLDKVRLNWSLFVIDL